MTQLFGYDKWSHYCRSFLLGLILLIGCNAPTPSPPSAEDLFKRTQTQLQQGQLAEALVTLDLVLAQNQQQLDALILAGQIAQKLGEHQRAVDYYSRVPVSDDALSLQALLAKAELLRGMGRLSSAQDAFQVLLELDDSNTVALSRLILLATLTGEHRSARPWIETLIDLGQFDAQTLASYGVRQWAMIETAYLQQCFEQAPEDLLVLLGLSRAALREKQFEEAERLMSRLRPLFPDSDSVLLLQGNLLQLTDLKGFLRWATQHIERFADEATYWELCGTALEQTGRTSQAAYCYREALRIDPLLRHSLFRLANLIANPADTNAETLLQTARSLQQAESLCTDVRPNGQNSEYLKQQAQIWLKLSQTKLAAAWVALARQHQPQLEWLENQLQQIRRVHRTGASVAQTVLAAIKRLPEEQFDIPQWDSPDLSGSLNLLASTDLPSLNFVDAGQELGLDFRYFEDDDPSTPGRRLIETNGGGVGVIDFNNDHWPDLYFTQGSHWPPEKTKPQYTDQLFWNRFGERFECLPESALPAELNYSMGIAVGDLNQDGFEDLVIANLGQNTIMYNNGDGTFDQADPSSYPDTGHWTSSIAIADLTGDGLPDIYEANYAEQRGAAFDPQAPVYSMICQTNGHPAICTPKAFDGAQDRVLVSTGAGQFEQQTHELGFTAPDGKAMGVVIANFDEVPGVEVFVSNDMEPNHFFVAEASGRYRNDALSSGLAFNFHGQAQACMGIALGDYNNDQRPDLLVTNFYQESNALYFNLGGLEFEDRAERSGIGPISFPQLGFGTQSLDVDADGDLDLFVINGDIDNFEFQGRPELMPPQILINQAGRFEELPASLAGPYFQQKWLGRGVAKVDFDRDLKTDLAVSHLRRPVALLADRSKIAPQQRIAFCLQGTDSLRHPVGATLQLSTPTITLTRFITAGDGYQATNDRWIQVGVPQGTSSASVVEASVIWPSGKQESYGQLECGHHWLLREGTRNALRMPTR